jgi:hypothetical protein
LSFGRTSSNGRLMWLSGKSTKESDIKLQLEFVGRGTYRKVQSLGFRITARKNTKRKQAT